MTKEIRMTNVPCVVRLPNAVAAVLAAAVGTNDPGYKVCDE